MIYVEERHLKIILDILKKYPYKFYAFGSRVKGTYRKLSDLDLCFFDIIPCNSSIEEEFKESDLPFQVDLVDFNQCNESFKQIIY